MCSVNRRLGAESLAHHGVAAPRGQAVSASLGGARFGRMFDQLPRRDPGLDAVTALADALEARSTQAFARFDNPDALLDGEAPPPPPPLTADVPAGYTYLAQFVDHDLTFDPASNLQRDNDPAALVDFRTPRLDLDSLYGGGPMDQPFLYDWIRARKTDKGVKLLVGGHPRSSTLAEYDLPRNQQHRALIGDARNDENLLISQLHLLFVRFYNAVVDRLAHGSEQLGGVELFEEAQRVVRWHYQWIVIHDLLDRVVGGDRANAARAGRRFFRPRSRPFMPVEFSGAAFRFGHSMVRPTYTLHGGMRRGVPTLPHRRARGPHLGGFRRLPRDLVVDWRRFFETTSKGARMTAMRIDPVLSRPLFKLPPDGASLARLNLQRGRALGLPAGADVARAIGAVPLSEEELQLGGIKEAGARDALLTATPLWYYVLCEAAAPGADGMRLGPVGGTIVSEVLVGLLESDPSSYARQWPDWTPDDDILARSDGAADGPGSPWVNGQDFTMADLVRFAYPETRTPEPSDPDE